MEETMTIEITADEKELLLVSIVALLSRDEDEANGPDSEERAKLDALFNKIMLVY